MQRKPPPDPPTDARSMARTPASLEIEVEIAGDRQLMQLISSDIGTGGVFLRSDHPAPLWKKVRLFLPRPQGNRLEVSGEVVRSVTREKARESGLPMGMAIAFDEISRARQKELITLVQELSVASSSTPTATGALPQSPPPKVAAPVLPPSTALPAATRSFEKPASKTEPVSIPVKSFSRGTSSVSKTRKPAAVAGGPFGELKSFLREYEASQVGDTYYDTLGVGLKASTDEIEAAFQHLVSKVKPADGFDALPSDIKNDASELYSKIRKAHAILNVPDRKKAYDFLIDNVE